MSKYIGQLVDDGGTELTFRWPYHNFFATTAPGAANDETQGYKVGSVWVDVTADLSYLCVDHSTGAAVWEPVGGGGGGTVTSVDVAGGTTGLTFSGGPVTTSGTITMAGTLAIANGGTGATSAGAARTALGSTAVGDAVFVAADAAAARSAIGAVIGTDVAAFSHTHAQADVTNLVTDLAAKAPLASPTFTGTPAAPTAGAGTSTTQIASTAFVTGAVASAAANLGKRARVRAATTANITIATALNNGDTLDGVTLATDDQVLVKNQTAPAENGIYTVGVSPARAAEFDTYNEHPGSLVAVEEGTANADKIWLCTSNDGGTLGTTAITWANLALSGDLLAANNLSDVASKIASFDNLNPSSTAIASASTTDLGTATGPFVGITGTATINDFGTVATGAERVLTFNGAGTITHNITSLILPGLADITRAAGDGAIMRSLGSGNWLCVAYIRASAPPVSGTNTGDQVVRTKLLTATTYYVRTDGSDSNTGLVNSAGGAFLTVQKAVNTLTAFDCNGLSYTITVGAGTFTTAVVLGAIVGGGTITINGAGDTTIFSTSGSCISMAGNLGDWALTNVKLTSSAGFCILLQKQSILRIAGINFGAAGAGLAQTLALTGSSCELEGNLSISGGAFAHWWGQQQGMFRVKTPITVTLLANVTFTYFILCEGGDMLVSGITYSPGAFAVTGTKYAVTINGKINTGGGGPNYFLGSIPGVFGSGGEYV